MLFIFFFQIAFEMEAEKTSSFNFAAAWKHPAENGAPTKSTESLPCKYLRPLGDVESIHNDNKDDEEL